VNPVTLSVGGQVVAEYVITPDIDPTLVPRPYLHPVRTLAGTVVTDVLPDDHRWHLGVSLAIADVAGANLWGGRSYVHGQGYVWLPDHGRIEHTGWRGLSAGMAAHGLRWQGPDGATLLAERRVVRAEDVDDGWRLTVGTSLANPSDAPLRLSSPAANGRGEGAGYGGFFWRLPPITGQAQSDRPLWTEDEVNGSSRQALTVSGATNGARYTLTFSGLSDDDRWFVRMTEYPAVGVALAFDRPLTIAPGATVHRQYQVVIRDN
jgi:hypothetical protein